MPATSLRPRVEQSGNSSPLTPPVERVPGWTQRKINDRGTSDCRPSVESFLKLSQARTIQRLQAGTTGTGPFAKENISETFPARVGAQSLFESTPEKHRRTRVLIPSSHPDSDADNVEGK